MLQLIGLLLLVMLGIYILPKEYRSQPFDYRIASAVTGTILAASFLLIIVGNGRTETGGPRSSILDPLGLLAFVLLWSVSTGIGFLYLRHLSRSKPR